MGARELLADLTRAGFSIEAAGDKLVVKPAAKLTDDIRTAIRKAKPELLTLLTRPYRLDPVDADAAHAEPWDDAAVRRLAARVLLFIRRGVDATDADDLAERLQLRDAQQDDRRLCLECRHLAGRGCLNARSANVGRELPPQMVTMLQRCPGFEVAS